MAREPRPRLLTDLGSLLRTSLRSFSKIVREIGSAADQVVTEPDKTDTVALPFLPSSSYALTRLVTSLRSEDDDRQPRLASSESRVLPATVARALLMTTGMHITAGSQRRWSESIAGTA